MVLILLLISLNCLRFFNLSAVPSGFYVDEAAGATQVICLAQMGIDLYGDHFPLFSAGAADALYTPLYLYGQILWTALVGFTPAGFRSFSGLVTCLTILFLYLWAKDLGGKRFAFYVAFSASISPWAFPFSRIAWDPPVAVLFLVAGLWATRLRHSFWIAGLFFAGAAYSYSPIRLSAVIILLLIPAVRLRQKALISGVMILACIPLFIEFSKPYFLERSKFLAIWGQHGLNPYAYSTAWELIQVFCHNFLSHLSANFLFFHGDGNLRHGIPNFGVLSWLDVVSFLALIILLGITCLKSNILKNKAIQSWQLTALMIGVIGIVANLIPASLTINVPHSLRSIGVYPFVAILTGLTLSYLDEKLKPKFILIFSIVIGLCFFSAYLYQYFGVYKAESAKVFQGDSSPIVLAYSRLARDGINCKQLPREPKNSKLFAPLRPLPNKRIDFSSAGYGKNYIGMGWHNEEPWGRWTAEPSAELLFFPPMGKPQWLILNLKTIISPSHLATHLEIWNDDSKLGTFTLQNPIDNEVKIPISHDRIQNNLFVIKLRVTNPITPAQAGISADTRPLGVGIVSAEFKE